MSEKKVLIYGASGYTGKIISECLAERNIGHIFAGRNKEKLEAAIKVVEGRLGRSFDVEVGVASNTPEELRPLFEKVDVVINVSGPFMQLGWPIVETALECNCHYLDTTGEQDWSWAIAQEYGQAFKDKGLLLSPACSYMWTAGALAAEMVLENKNIDTLDILYQIDNGAPSEASTRSFLRMLCNDQLFLSQNEFAKWETGAFFKVNVPYRAAALHAFPWGGACEPLWYKDDPQVRNCQVLTAFGEHMAPAVIAATDAFLAEAKDLPQEQKEEWTNNYGDTLSGGEPEKDDKTVGRSVIICYGQGQQETTKYVMNMSAPYCWTGEIAAESALRLIEGKLKHAGFQSAAKAFGHRELITRFHELGYCSAVPEELPKQA